MNKYRKLTARELPYDGDIVTMKQGYYSARENCFRYMAKCYRVERFRNSSVSCVLRGIDGKPRHTCLVNNPDIVAAYTRA